MALVKVEGTFLGAGLREKKGFGDKPSKHVVQIDVYQPNSSDKDKSVSVECEDLSLLTKFQQDFSMGDHISLECTINAYKNVAYYKYVG